MHILQNAHPAQVANHYLLTAAICLRATLLLSMHPAAPPPSGDIGSALQLLQGDFSSGDQEIRLHAIKRARLVAEVMGPEATREELLPFLSSIIDDDDEVLLALAEQLGKFVPLVGGPTHAALLLPW
jgi:hypothetical protein